MLTQRLIILIIPFFLWECKSLDKKIVPTNNDSLIVHTDTQPILRKIIKFDLQKPTFKNHYTTSGNPFLLLNFDKVVAYDYEGRRGEEILDIIDSSGILANTVTKERILTRNQIDRVTYLLGDNSTYGEAYADCFDPHLGLLFFNVNKVVASLDICLECNRLYSSIKIPATYYKHIQTGNDYEYPAEGFSKIGRQKINSLCKEFRFDHCKD